jgi:hypothetical protein
MVVGLVMALMTLAACSNTPSGAPVTTKTDQTSRTLTGTKAAPGQIVTAYAVCTRALNQFSASGMMGFSGTEGNWAPMAAVPRGTSTLVLLGVESAPQGPNFGGCLVAGPKDVDPVSDEWSGATTVPPRTITSEQGGSSGIDSTGAQGGAGAGVKKVTLVLANGVRVAAVVAHGTYASFWPGESSPVAALVETSTGWHRQRLGG